MTEYDEYLQMLFRSTWSVRDMLEIKTKLDEQHLPDPQLGHPVSMT